MRLPSLILLLSLPGIAFADRNEIPLNELGFVDSVKVAGKARIVEQLGEPVKAVDLTDRNGEVFASIWHYHYLNTSEEGDYYKTTELDFVGDQVVTVVFSNNDTEEPEAIAASPGTECPAVC
jgi:hypothetical protein